MARRQRIAYGYKEFTYDQSKTILADTIKTIQASGITVDIAYSPSGCACLRVALAHINPKLGIPASKATYWPVMDYLSKPYLYKEWAPIPAATVRRRRRTV